MRWTSKEDNQNRILIEVYFAKPTNSPWAMILGELIGAVFRSSVNSQREESSFKNSSNRNDLTLLCSMMGCYSLNPSPCGLWTWHSPFHQDIWGSFTVQKTWQGYAPGISMYVTRILLHLLSRIMSLYSKTLLRFSIHLDDNIAPSCPWTWTVSPFI